MWPRLRLGRAGAGDARYGVVGSRGRIRFLVGGADGRASAAVAGRSTPFAVARARAECGFAARATLGHCFFRSLGVGDGPNVPPVLLGSASLLGSLPLGCCSLGAFFVVFGGAEEAGGVEETGGAEASDGVGVTILGPATTMWLF
jgi:hypothetical protein